MQFMGIAGQKTKNNYSNLITGILWTRDNMYHYPNILHVWVNDSHKYCIKFSNNICLSYKY